MSKHIQVVPSPSLVDLYNVYIINGHFFGEIRRDTDRYYKFYPSSIVSVALSDKILRSIANALEDMNRAEFNGYEKAS